MTPDERNLLSRFLQDLGQARGGLKDAEAADLIDRAIRNNPDASYLLVQHAIIADQALHAAQDRIADLEQQVRGGQSQGGGSFLGGRGGPWSGQAGYGQQPQSPPYGSGQQYQPPQGRGGMLGGLFGGGAQSGPPGGFGSFLRTAGTTAAGVAGGEFLFRGLSNMFGGGDRFGAPVENVTINEYGDGGDPGGYDDGGYDDGGQDDGSWG